MAKTVEEISQLAGVSITTVRLVINGQAQKYRISKKTQKKIQDLIEEHGYVLNQAARSLKLQKTQTLGLVVPRLSNPFFSELAETLEAICRASGYQLVTVTSDDDEEQEKEVTDILYSRDVDGLFVATCSKERQLKLMEEKRKNKPLIFLDRDFGVADSVVVATHNLIGAQELGESMATTSDEIYFIGGDPSFPTMIARLKGLISGFGNKGINLPEENIRFSGKNTRENGYQKMDALFRELNKAPETLITGSLPILEGALECLKEHYDRIPEYMTIGSFDDHAMLDFLSNRVFSIKQNTRELAQLSFDKMKKLLAQEKLEQKFNLILPELVER